MPTVPPFGYRHQDDKLVPDEQEQATLHTIREHRQRKPPTSYGRLAAELNRNGTLNRGKFWNPTTLWYLVRKEEMKGGER